MIHTRTNRISARRGGFSLLEATIVSMFTAVLGILVSATWGAFLRPTADIANRCRIAQEATLALSALSKDLSGSFVDNPADGKSKFKLVGRMQPDDSQLRLCFDAGETPNGTADWAAPDLVVTYYVDNHRLIRWDEDSGATFVAARDVDSLEVTDLGDGQVQIQLTFLFRQISQTYTLIASDP